MEKSKILFEIAQNNYCKEGMSPGGRSFTPDDLNDVVQFVLDGYTFEDAFSQVVKELDEIDQRAYDDMMNSKAQMQERLLNTACDIITTLEMWIHQEELSEEFKRQIESFFEEVKYSDDIDNEVNLTIEAHKDGNTPAVTK